MAHEEEHTEMLRAQEEDAKARMLSALRLAHKVWHQAGLPDGDLIALALIACELFRHMQSRP